MAQQPAQSNPSTLALRVASAGVMLPVVLAAVWLGSVYFAALVAVAAGLMYWEWRGLCGMRRPEEPLYAAFSGAGPVLQLVAGSAASLGTGAVGAAINAVRAAQHRLFLTTGFVYIYLACIGLVWLRQLDHFGLETVLWLGAAVVMTDTCAYFTGRTLGGPKLAPRISPKKTWSGLLGGVLGAGLAGAAVAWAIGASILAVSLASGILAVVAQIGDLAVSKAKRKFGIKDSGHIIPGHGGVLDRFDGILSATVVMVPLCLVGGGSPLSWL